MVIEENPFDHVLYEFTMYYNSLPLDSGNKLLNNLKVDSHLLHLRNLAYFFDKKKQCDIHASVYVNNSSSVLLDSKSLSDVYHRTNCAACHMSKERLKASFKRDTIVCEKRALRIMDACISKYLELLDTDIKDEYADQWNDERIQKIANLLRGKGK